MNYPEVAESINREFEKLLEGPGISWNKTGMKIALSKALSTVFAKLLEEREKELNDYKEKNPSRI